MSKQPADTSIPHLRIGELSALSGRSVYTIRWYEAQNLMPGAARDAGGRRVFSQAHVDWLDLMTRLRSSGISIRQMQAYARQVREGKATLAKPFLDSLADDFCWTVPGTNAWSACRPPPGKPSSSNRGFHPGIRRPRPAAPCRAASPGATPPAQGG